MSYKNIEILVKDNNCEVEHSLAILDIMNVISGKWRIPIIAAIMYKELRYTEIHRLIPAITPRMLTKELRELELSGIVKRTVYDSSPVKIGYSLTTSGQELEEVIIKMVEWGVKYRKREMQK